MINMEVNFTNLGTIVDTIIDYRGKTPLKLGGIWEDSPKGNYRAFSAKNIKTGKIVQHDEIRYVSPELYKKWMKVEIKRGDIFITSEAPFGQIFYWDSDEKIVLSQRLFAVRIKQEIYDKYAYYYMISGAFQGEMKARSTGSTVEGLRQPALLRCNFAYPKYQSQKKIATLLWNYDQLIENNNKRIKLLEDMAGSLYKEWFVRFRFPGHEKKETKLQSAKGWAFGDREDGQTIPKDWNFKELIEIAEFKRGKNITSSEMVEGHVPVIAAGLEPSGYHDKANVKGYNLTVSASGANAGYLAYHLEDIWAADCSYYQNDENLWFVYNALKFLQPVISNMQIGSAQPHVYAKNINRLSTIIPDKGLMKAFVDKVKPIYDEIKILNEKNELLAKQRDSLLPRLMSGKLSVEGKEII